MRITSSNGVTKILPSPNLPVPADFVIASITWSSMSSEMTTSILYLWYELDLVFGAAISFSVPFLSSIPLHLTYCHTRNTHLLQCISYRVQKVASNDRFDLLHSICLLYFRSLRGNMGMMTHSGSCKRVLVPTSGSDSVRAPMVHFKSGGVINVVAITIRTTAPKVTLPTTGSLTP